MSFLAILVSPFRDLLILELTGGMVAPQCVPLLALPLVNLSLYDQLFLAEVEHVAA